MVTVFNDTMQIIPIKSWCNNLESGALEQAMNLSKLPFAFRWIALMPDCHQGYGMPIGGVLATRGIIIPNAVGVDIGCGMHYVETGLDYLDTDVLKKIMGEIRQAVPVGFNHHKEPHDIPDLPDNLSCDSVLCNQWASAKHQVGTLGGGNHFIEIQKTNHGTISFMIHSGSRNLGKKVCDYYNKIAKDVNSKWFSSVDPKADLAFLPMDDYMGKNYYHEMYYCLEFAKANRQMMADNIKGIFANITSCEFVFEHDIHHNYAAYEHHMGEDVLIHRKGATRAYSSEIGIIPGSQGTKSYIVRGLGNPESFMSCSHGAGRKMGRKEAQRTLNLQDEQRRLNEQGIIHSVRNAQDLDEASGAYKNIDEVMASQGDLVEIVTELTPMGVIKG